MRIFIFIMNLLKGDQIQFDKHLGVIRHEMTDNQMILVDDTVTIQATLQLHMPIISTTGQCSLINKGKENNPEVAINIMNSSHPQHKSEVNMLGSLMATEMSSHTEWLINKLTRHLGITDGPKYVDQPLNLIDLHGPKICKDDNYTCHFALSPNLNQGCVNANNRPMTNVHHKAISFKEADFDPKNLDKDTWHSGRCGMVSRTRDANGTYINVSPSFCCTITGPNDQCPEEARLMLRNYADVAKHTTAPAIFDDENHSYCVTPTKIVKRVSEKELSPQKRNRRDYPDMYRRSQTFKSVPKVTFKHDKFGRFMLGLSPLLFELYVETKRLIFEGRKEKARLQKETQLVNDILSKSKNFNGTNVNDTTTVSELVTQIKNVNREKLLQEKEKMRLKEQAKQLRNLGVFLNSYNATDVESKTQLHQLMRDLQNVSKPIRSRRSTMGKFGKWAEYWLDGGFLTNRFNQQQIDFNNKSLQEVRHLMKENENELISMGQKFSRGLQQVNQILCTNRMNEWRNSLMIQERQIASTLESEILDTIEQCVTNQVPYLTNIENLIKICKSQTHERHHDICENNISKLFTCQIKNIWINHKSVNFHMEMRIKLPSYETGLRQMQMRFYNVIPKPLKTLGMFASSPSKSKNENKEVANKDVVDAEESKQKEDLQTLQKLLNVLQTRSRRSVGLQSILNQDLKNYVKLKLPNLFIFYSEKNSNVFIAFEQCEEREGLIICTLGKSEFWNHQMCIQSLLEDDLEAIKTKCPIEIKTSGSCMVSKYRELTIVATHEPIDVSETTSKDVIFKGHTSQCEDVCLISRGLNQKTFSCDERQYRIPNNNTIQLTDSIKTTRDIKERINVNGFNYDLLNENTKAVRFQDKLIYLSDKWHTVLYLITILTCIIVGIVMVFIIIKKMSPFKMIRKCRHNKRKQRKSQIILKKEFSDESEDDEDWRNQRIVF